MGQSGLASAGGGPGSACCRCHIPGTVCASSWPSETSNQQEENQKLMWLIQDWRLSLGSCWRIRTVYGIQLNCMMFTAVVTPKCHWEGEGTVLWWCHRFVIPWLCKSHRIQKLCFFCFKDREWWKKTRWLGTQHDSRSQMYWTWMQGNEMQKSTLWSSQWRGQDELLPHYLLCCLCSLQSWTKHCQLLW